MMLVVKEYRRKPDALQAVMVTAENVADVARWCGGEHTEDAKPGDPTDVAVMIKVPNVDGTRTVRNNGYVIKHGNGRFYTCDSDSFLNEYEEIAIQEYPKEVKEPDFELTPKLTPHYVPRGKHPFGN